MSHGLLGDSVDTTLAGLLYYSCTTDAVFSEVYDQWAMLSEPRKTCVADALTLCGSWASCICNSLEFVSMRSFILEIWGVGQLGVFQQHVPENFESAEDF